MEIKMKPNFSQAKRKIKSNNGFQLYTHLLNTYLNWIEGFMNGQFPEPAEEFERIFKLSKI